MLLGDPLPREPVFSVFCRTAVRSGATNSYLLKRYGAGCISSLFSAFPSSLSKIAQSVPASHKWHDPVTILRENTIFRYYTHFDSADRIVALENRAREPNQPQSLSIPMGLANYRSYPANRHPRFCRDCVREDEHEHGFAYFHCEHQLPGVALCWLHITPLEIGCRRCGPAPLRNAALQLPGQCLCDDPKPLRAFQSLPSSTETLRWITTQSALLLSCPSKILRRDLLLSRAIDAGYRIGRKANYDLVAEALSVRYGEEVLDWLGYPRFTNGRPSTWWSAFLWESDQQLKTTSIAVILYCGLFFKSVTDYESAPEKKVNTKRLVNQAPAKVNRTPDKKVGRLPPWRGRLAEFLKSASVYEVARERGIPLHKLLTEAQRQGLTVPLPSKVGDRLGRDRVTEIVLALEAGRSPEIVRAQFHTSWPTVTQIVLANPHLKGMKEQRCRAKKAERLEQHRNALIAFIQSHSPVYRVTLFKELGATYCYLIKHAREWLSTMVPLTPPVVRCRPCGKQIDWKHRDQDFKYRIEVAYRDLTHEKGKPQRISKERLLRRAGILQAFKNHPDLLPHSARLLSRLEEPKQTYYCRRVAYAVGEVADRGDVLTSTRLRETSLLKYPVLRTLKGFILRVAEKSKGEVDFRSLRMIFDD